MVCAQELTRTGPFPRVLALLTLKCMYFDGLPVKIHALICRSRSLKERPRLLTHAQAIPRMHVLPCADPPLRSCAGAPAHACLAVSDPAFSLMRGRFRACPAVRGPAFPNCPLLSSTRGGTLLKSRPLQPATPESAAHHQNISTSFDSARGRAPMAAPKFGLS